MATINIGGRRVKVGDEFLALSPEDQQKTVDEIAANLPGEERVGEATKRGFLRGASFDFLDELEGLARAGGLDPKDENVANAIKSLFVGGYRKFKGDPEAEKLYTEQRDIGRELSKGLEEQHPYATLGGQLGGGLAVPFGAAARLATLGSRARAAAKTGAVVGGLTGFGAGEDLGGSLTGAAIGAPVGAAAGAALTPVVEGAVQLGARALAPFRGAFNPAAEAERRIGGAFQRDAQMGDVGLSPAEYAAAQQTGAPVAAVDLGGTATRALARSAANTSPEARAALERATSDRFGTQGERVSSFVRQQFHYPDADAQQAAMEAAQRAGNRAAYTRANADPAARQVWSDELGRLADSDEVRAAMFQAQKKAQSRAVEEGIHYAPLQANAFVDEAGQLTMRTRNGAPTYPDLRFWDYTRRELSQAAQAAYRGGHSDDGARLASLARQMNAELDRLVPAYQEARAGAARFFGAENALEAGRNFVGGAGRYELREARRAIAQMSETERRLFQDGYADRLAQMIEKSGDRTNILNKIATSPAAREELEIALGRQGAAALEARLRVEGIMDRMRNALGNSTTARQLAELGLAGGVGGFEYLRTGGDILHGGGGAVIALALTRGRHHIDQRVAQRVGELLASPDPAAAQRGINLIANNQTLMRALREADNATARLGGQQAGEQLPPLLRQ